MNKVKSYVIKKHLHIKSVNKMYNIFFEIINDKLYYNKQLLPYKKKI